MGILPTVPEKEKVLLMEEILHHLGCLKPCKKRDKLPVNWLAGFLPSTVFNRNRINMCEMFDHILHWGGWPCCFYFSRVWELPHWTTKGEAQIFVNGVIRPFVVRSFGKILMQIHSVWHADIRTIIWLLSVVSLFSSLYFLFFLPSFLARTIGLQFCIRWTAIGSQLRAGWQLHCLASWWRCAQPYQAGRVLHHWTAVARSPRKITTLHGNDHISLTTFESMIFFFQKVGHVCSQEGNFCLGNFG